MRDHERRLRDLEARLGAGKDTGCCRLNATEYRNHLEARAFAREHGDPEPQLYLLHGGCHKHGGDLCPEARDAAAAILDRRRRLEQNTQGLIESEL